MEMENRIDAVNHLNLFTFWAFKIIVLSSENSQITKKYVSC